MSTMHDNGRSGHQPEPDALADLIDLLGAAVTTAVTASFVADGAAVAEEPHSNYRCAALFSAANDAREARWYLARALERLRELI